MSTLKSQSPQVDRFLFFLVVILTLFGTLMVYEASSVTAFRDFGDKYFYVKQQALWAIIGFGALFFFSRFDYHRLAKFSPIFLFFTFLFLLLVLVPGFGMEALGARRWLGLGFLSFQPAELAKLSFILYFASLFAKKVALLPFLAVLVLGSGLMMLEPDLGTTVVILLTGFSLYFLAGANLFSLLSLSFLALILGIFLIFSSSYRRARFLTFLDFTRDPLGASYHIRQVLLALGSGGLWGVGLGASRQKFAYLPEAMTDSIFAIIAEEIGFIGTLVLITLFLLIIYRGLKIALSAPDRLGELLAGSLSAWIAIQTLVNLASMVALVPLTGVPLPFLSYGGSSLIVSLVGVGILLNISKYRVKKK